MVDGNPLYPIFLKLEDKRVLVVGGGMIAYQKLKALLNTDAEIVVIAPTICHAVWSCRGEFPYIRPIKFIERDYEFGDEKEAFMVIAATDLPELNNQIANRCRDQMILVNSVDEPDYCDFYVPSVIEAGDIKVGISTNGKAPAIAQRIRLDLQSLIEDKYMSCVKRVNDFRAAVHAKWTGQDSFDRRAKLIRWFTQRVLDSNKDKVHSEKS